MIKKNVFITGTNKGIGKAILLEFAKEKANIFAHTRKETPEFISLLEDIRKKYDITVTPVYFDMLDTQKMKDEIKNLYKNKVHIDILVNNAGMALLGLFQMMSITKVKEVFNVNFFSHLELTQLVLKSMTKRKSGCIINVSSISGIDLKEGNTAYGSSKAAISAWTKVLSKELARFNIRVNAIAPGIIDTDMTASIEQGSKEDSSINFLMNRKGTPKEVADVVLYLASEKASFINGQILRIDGGEK